MTITPPPPLTGPALAAALEQAGLMPPGVQRQDYADLSVWWRGNTQRWQPWRNIGDVWHLVTGFGLDICAPRHGSTQWRIQQLYDDGPDEYADTIAAIPAAICRLALRLAAQHTEGDATP